MRVHPSWQRNVIIATWYGIVDMKSRLRMRGPWVFPLQIQRAVEGCTNCDNVGVAMRRPERSGGSNRPLYKAVKIKLGLHWWDQYYRDTRTETTSRDNWRQEMELIHGSNVCYRQHNWESTAIYVIMEHVATGFGVCAAGSLACFGTVFLLYAPLLLFRMVMSTPAILCWLYELFLRSFYRIAQSWDYFLCSDAVFVIMMYLLSADFRFSAFFFF